MIPANEKTLLKNDLVKAKKLQIELLTYYDVESVIIEIGNYLEVIKMIGKTRVNRHKLFSTKLIKKIKCKLELICEDTLEIDTKPNEEQKWNNNYRPLTLENAKCSVTQLREIIDSAATIYIEGYQGVIGSKSQLVFGALSMIKDVEKAVGEIPTIWRQEYVHVQMKGVA